MAKNKRELQAELEAANKRIAELSQSNQNANSNINNEEPPFWLKTLLEAQSESQRQMQQIIERFSQQQLAQSQGHLERQGLFIDVGLTRDVITSGASFAER